MILISHRGNINGRIEGSENEPSYIDDAIRLGYNVEIDVRTLDGHLYLGHDEPQYKIDIDWLIERSDKLWIHCKDLETIVNIGNIKQDILNYFWHENDTVTLTSKKYIWAFPGKQPILASIAVAPELNDDDVSKCIGICSDHIISYKKL